MRISDWSSDVCSSDLSHAAPAVTGPASGARPASSMPMTILPRSWLSSSSSTKSGTLSSPASPWLEARGRLIRSEEHTSELQSLMRIPYAVFYLKKKNTLYHKEHEPTPHSPRNNDQ